jgi:hypothetical protein
MPRAAWAGPSLLALSVAVYLALLVYKHESVPGAPYNDIAEETLSGYLMIRDQDFVPISTAVNPSGIEALHVLVVGALVHLLGGEALAILIPAWAATLLLVLLLYWFSRTNAQLLDAGAVVPVALACLWMFHYARTGLRAVSSPALLLLFVVLLQSALRRRRVHPTDVLAGAVLALGTYGYTSSRLVVLTFALFGALELVRATKRSRDEGTRFLRKLAAAAGGFLPVFSWNAAWALREPETFFGRGAYVIRGEATDWLANVWATLLLPVHYAEPYRYVLGEGHNFDSVAVALPMAGLSAIPPLLGAVSFVGLFLAVRNHRDRPVVRFLLLFYVVAVLALGFTGPSLTRLYILFPIIMLFIGIGLNRLIVTFPRQRSRIVLVLYAVAAFSLWSYFQTPPSSDPTKLHGADMAAAVGRRARALSAEGRTPLCVVSQDRNVVRYFTIGHWDEVRIREIYRRPFRLRKIQDQLPHVDVILVDEGPNLKPLVRLLEGDERFREAPPRAYFHEFHLQPPAGGSEGQSSETESKAPGVPAGNLARS